MKRTFFFDSHPPFGKQLIAAVAYLAGFDGERFFCFKCLALQRKSACRHCSKYDTFLS